MPPYQGRKAFSYQPYIPKGCQPEQHIDDINPFTLPEKPFPFLGLPGEIRSIIYEYALTEPDGLHYHHSGKEITASPIHSRKCRGSKRWRVRANQLMFTCRQIWNETRGLGLKFNTLHFKGMHRSHPFASEQALEFLGDISPYRYSWSRREFCNHTGPNRVSWIRHITLTQAPSVEIAGWTGRCCELSSTTPQRRCPGMAAYCRTVALVKFAQLHPHIRFDLDITLPPHEYETTTPSMRRLVIEIVRHLFLFRGCSSSSLPVHLDMMDFDYATQLLIPSEDPATLIAPNIHFHVPKYMVDDLAINEEYESDWRFTTIADDYASGEGLSKLKADLKAWVEIGF